MDETLDFMLHYTNLIIHHPTEENISIFARRLMKLMIRLAMDELRQLLTDFHGYDDAMPHNEFMRKFVRIMYTLTTLMQEVLANTQIRGESYNLNIAIRNELLQLAEHLQIYQLTVANDE